MLQAILELFTTEQKAEAMLSNSIIEFIFMTLFILFFLTLLVHLTLFFKLRKIRNYLKETNRMDMEPLQSFQRQFDEQENIESTRVETFVQERFSSWRFFNVPVINLIKLVQMTVSVFILIGVLGTFIGLTISLGSINSSSDQLVENVASVLSGIDVAFYTSIFGMGFSLIMTVLVKVFNTEYVMTDMMLMVESNLTEEEEPSMSRLIDVSETINQSILQLQETNQTALQGIVDSFAGFQEYTTGLQQSAKDLALFNEGLSNNLEDFQELFHQMKTVTDGFGEGTLALNKNFEALFSYFKKSDRKNERMATAFEGTYEKMEETAKAQTDTLLHFEDAVADLKTFTTSLLDEQAVIHGDLEKITQKSDDLVEMMGVHNREFKDIFGNDLSTELKGITTYLSELSKDFDKLGHSIVQLPDALEVINKTQNEYKHLLSDRFRELEEFNQSFSNHLKDHATESASFEKQMRDASHTYEQMGIKNSQLINEISTTLAKMDQTFNQRENQLEASVGVLKDTLSTYVGNVEGTIGNRLEQIVRQIADSMDQTSEGIKREFTEIRRITEDVQLNQSRSMQHLIQELGREIQLLNRNLSMLSQEPAPVNSRIGWNQNES